jgi:hypothetical protein
MQQAWLEIHHMDIDDGDGVVGRVYAGVKE